MIKAGWLALLAGGLALTFVSGPGHAADQLGAYPIDPAQVSVAGVSSGAFMASQLHVAHSAGVMGAAMIGGGLYGCAIDTVETDGVVARAPQAAERCMKDPSMLDGVASYKSIVDKVAQRGWIDPPSNIRRARLYFFAGGAGSVTPGAVAEGRDLYVALGVPTANIVFDDPSGLAARAGRSWETISQGSSCSIGDCGHDQAGAELKAIYGAGLAAPAGPATGRVVAFDQTEFAPDRAWAANGLDKTGYLYVPKACEPGAKEPCRLQVALHGCRQSAEVLGDHFFTGIGLNEWADANRIVVLYPQAHATTVAELPSSLWLTGLANANPGGCWNWRGYSGDTQYLTKKGAQVGAIWGMIERLEGK